MQKIIIKDRVYGDTEVTEPVITELINSPALQRLKQINQVGYPQPYFPKNTLQRYEHSLGVFALLKKYKAPLEEQIAGLIHDVSHSAFSHTIDYVLNSGSEKKHTHQDDHFKSFIQKTTIPKILLKNNYDIDYILNNKNFPLLETELPDLCADRIDYSFRTALTTEEMNQNGALSILNHLKVTGNQWYFDNIQSAIEYANLFKNLNQKYYACLGSAVMFSTTGDYLRHSLQRGYIIESDLYTNDNIVLKKTEKHHGTDSQLKNLWDKMNNKTSFLNDPKDYDAHVFCKSRVVDPLCGSKNSIKRLSKPMPKWKEMVEKELKPKEYFIKFENYEIRK